jgi:hypothetical protein
LGKGCKRCLETDRHLNTGLVSWKTRKGLTIGFHGKGADAAGEVVDKFVGFLEAAFSIFPLQDDRKKDEPLRKFITEGSVNLEEASNVQPALKHSCPQKNEPVIPSLPCDEMAKQVKRGED